MIILKIVIKDGPLKDGHMSTIECDVLEQTGTNKHEIYIKGLIITFMKYLGERFFPKFHGASTFVKEENNPKLEPDKNHEPRG